MLDHLAIYPSNLTINQTLRQLYHKPHYRISQSPNVFKMKTSYIALFAIKALLVAAVPAGPSKVCDPILNRSRD